MLIDNPWLERILMQEGPGGPVARLSVVAPSVVQVGEPFLLRLAAVDAKGYASLECEGQAVVSGEAGLSLQFVAGRPAAGALGPVTLTTAGLHRVAVEFHGDQWLSNPICCEPQPSTRLWWGDPHVHTILSRCHWERCRTLNYCFTHGRYVTGLDWVTAADHVSNGRTDVSKWKVQRVTARLFNDPPAFVALLGYEASLRGGAGGDNNVYFADEAETYVDAYEEGSTRALCDGLLEQGADFLIVPHHTTRTGKHGELSPELYLGRKHMPVVEIHSKWGTSEYRGNPHALHEVHPGPSYAQDFLRHGLPLGFIAGTDTHATVPSGYGDDAGHIDRLPGFTAVRADALSRRAVFDAVRHRNCYGTCGERIYVEAEIAGNRPGVEVDWAAGRSDRRIAATAAAESEITEVAVLRNGETVHAQAGDGWRAALDWTDTADLGAVAFPPAGALEQPFVYYYLRVTCASGAQAWTSPVWLTL